MKQEIVEMDKTRAAEVYANEHEIEKLIREQTLWEIKLNKKE